VTQPTLERLGPLASHRARSPRRGGRLSLNLGGRRASIVPVPDRGRVRELEEYREASHPCDRDPVQIGRDHPVRSSPLVLLVRTTRRLRCIN